MIRLVNHQSMFAPCCRLRSVFAVAPPVRTAGKSQHCGQPAQGSAVEGRTIVLGPSTEGRAQMARRIDIVVLAVAFKGRIPGSLACHLVSARLTDCILISKMRHTYIVIRDTSIP